MKDGDEDIEIISTEDDRIKIIGEIFSNDSSRKILKTISKGNEMTANEIAQENEISLALAIHHLKRMQSAGMIKVSKTGISAKGQEMKYYVSTNQSFLITSEESTNSLVESLKKFSKFAAIGMAGVVSWFALKPNQGNLDIQPHDSGMKSSIDEFAISEDEVEFSESIAEPVPEPEPQPEPEPEIEYWDSADTDAVFTGSASADRTVYPQPFDSLNDGGVESLVVAMVVSVSVVIGGIVLERILARLYNKRRQNKKLRDRLP
ncbi:MAG: helix-turn-helix domain-containing protein [Nitrosopumilus sp.]|nr:helix-turn-helix domain-containing protein [Nitrosopumilus sp.]